MPGNCEDRLLTDEEVEVASVDGANTNLGMNWQYLSVAKAQRDLTASYYQQKIAEIFEWLDECCYDNEHLKLEGSVKIRWLCTKCRQDLKKKYL